MKQLVLWGRGRRLNKLVDNGILSRDNVRFIIDKDEHKRGNWYGIPVITPKEAESILTEKDTIVITSDIDPVIIEVRDYVNRNQIKGEVFTYDEYIADILGFGEERKKLLDQIFEVGRINQDALNSVKIFSDRADALSCVPKGGVATEIGVAYGDFSQSILDTVSPELFIAIDYFSKNDPYRCFMGRTDFMMSHKTHQEWYEEKFSSYIREGKMKVMQGLSWDVLAELEDDYLDFAYIDACHNYDAVDRDVSVLINKIKDGGVIAFNDYVCVNVYSSPLNHDSYYGVVPVANRLINETGSEVIAIAMQAGLCNDVFVRLNKL